MRWRGQRESENVEDRRGTSSRKATLGAGTVAIALLATYLLGGDPIQVFMALNRAGYVDVSGSSRRSHADGRIDNGDIEGVGEEAKQFVSVVLASTEDVWGQILEGQYTPPRLILFSDSVESACGFASAASGPFYCPGDRRLYLDFSFFHQLRELGASGDFAAAYVIGHEVGHHVQTLMGIADKVTAFQSRASKKQGNAMQVKMELQADCYAGVWAKHSGMLEEGDVEEGLAAAASVGDDHIMRSAGRAVSPESFTHGSSEQRRDWFVKGFEGGEVGVCDTFGGEGGLSSN